MAMASALSRETPTEPLLQDNTAKDEGLQNSPDTQTTPPHSSELRESTGVQDSSVNTDHELVQVGGTSVRWSCHCRISIFG